MQDIARLIAGLLVVVIFVGFWICVFRKAGFSFWWGVLMPIPVVNFIPVCIFVFREWPIQKELARLRTQCGVADEGDAYLVLRDALQLELQGKTLEALLKYQEIATRFHDTTVGNDAEKSVAALLQKAMS
jgi:hypothetical protein